MYEEIFSICHHQKLMCVEVYLIGKICRSKENQLILEFFEVVVKSRVQLLDLTFFSFNTG